MLHRSQYTKHNNRTWSYPMDNKANKKTRGKKNNTVKTNKRWVACKPHPHVIVLRARHSGGVLRLLHGRHVTLVVVDLRQRPGDVGLLEHLGVRSEVTLTVGGLSLLTAGTGVRDEWTDLFIDPVLVRALLDRSVWGDVHGLHTHAQTHRQL